MATKARLILRKINGKKLRDSVKDMEVVIQGKMDNNPEWELRSISLVKFNDGYGGKNYLLAAMTR